MELFRTISNRCVHVSTLFSAVSYLSVFVYVLSACVCECVYECKCIYTCMYVLEYVSACVYVFENVYVNVCVCV